MSTRRSRRPRVGAACLLVLMVLLSGCSDGGLRPATAPVGGPVTGAAASNGQAAELVAGLTWVLGERVHTADSASPALAGLLAGPDEAARLALLAALRRVDRQQAGGARSLRAALLRIAPGLAGAELEQAVADLAAAPGGTGSYAVRHAASLRARETAGVLAAGVAAARDLGPTSTRAVALRADLTGLLHEHVALTAALARELAEGAPEADGARTALAVNTSALAAVLGVAYPDLEDPFSQAWSAHVLRLEAAATAVVVTGSPSGPTLESAARTLAAVLASTVVGLPVERLTAELAPLLAAQLRAVESAARLSPAAAEDLRRATAEVPAPVALISAAIAEHLRLS